MDRQNTKVKMAVKMLLDYLLENREALKLMAKKTDPSLVQPQPLSEKVIAPDRVQLKRLKE